MALRTYPRDSYVLSTKVGYFLRPDVGGVRPSPPQHSADPAPLSPSGRRDAEQEAPVAKAGMEASMPFTMEFDYSYEVRRHNNLAAVWCIVLKMARDIVVDRESCGSSRTVSSASASQESTAS